MKERLRSALVDFILGFSAATKAAIAAALNKRPPPFSGVYRSFSDVPGRADFGASTMWQEQQRYVATLSRTETGRAGMRRLIRSKAVLPVVVAFLAANGRPVRVLDFGGGAGQDFGNLLASGSVTDVSYHVVDVAPICEIGRSVWADDSRVSFSAELPAPDARFDLVYAFSAIQYIEDTDALLRHFASYQPRAILLMAHPLAEVAFVRSQVNMDVVVPQAVPVLPRVREVLAQSGYELAMKAWSETDLNVENYDEPHRVPGDANLLFLRRG